MSKLTKADLRAINLAVNEASRSVLKQKHGAVLFKNRRIVSKGYNRIKTHPAAKKHYDFPYIHAEFDALIKSRTELRHGSVAVVRINNRGELLNSKPCNDCLKFMKEYGITTVIYSTKNSIKKQNLKELL